MTIERLYQALCLKFPELAASGRIFWDHIVVQENNEVLPPYIVMKRTETNPFYADDTAYYLTVNDQLIVFTDTYDSTLLDAVELFLKENAVTFTSESKWDDGTFLWETSYTLALAADEGEEES